MGILKSILARKNEIYDVARKYNVDNLYVFGSCARGEDTSDSDIDILVEFSSHSRFGDQVQLSDALNTYFGKKVDVVSARGLSPYFSKRIWKEAVAV